MQRVDDGRDQLSCGTGGVEMEVGDLAALGISLPGTVDQDGNRVTYSPLLGWQDVARVMSAAPARIGGLRGYGAAFGIGEPAQLTLVDPSATRDFATSDLRGRSANSPYLGRTLPGRVEHVWHGGARTLADAVLVEDLGGDA